MSYKNKRKKKEKVIMYNYIYIYILGKFNEDHLLGPNICCKDRGKPNQVWYNVSVSYYGPERVRSIF